MATTGALTDYVEDKIAKWIFFNTLPTAFATLYIALYTAAPTDVAASGTEVTTSGTAYARQGVTTGTSGTGVGSGWTETTPTTNVANTADILFAVATANYGTVLSIAIHDAVTAGNMLVRADLAAGIIINTNDQFKIPATQLVVTID